MEHLTICTWSLVNAQKHFALISSGVSFRYLRAAMASPRLKGFKEKHPDVAVAHRKKAAVTIRTRWKSDTDVSARLGKANGRVSLPGCRTEEVWPLRSPAHSQRARSDQGSKLTF